MYGNYPSNSGPPPAPLGGAYSGYGAYGGGGYATNNAAYPGGGGFGGGFGGAPYGGAAYGAPNPYGGMGMGMNAAVPGFTAPAGHAPPQMPMSMQFSHAQQATQPFGCQMQSMTQMLHQRDPGNPIFTEMKEMRQQMEQMKNSESDQRRELEEKYQKQLEEVQRKAAEEMETNKDAKEQMRQGFIDELMRRQDFNGTFEDTAGVINPCIKYTENDPVAIWYGKEKFSIVDEAWNAEYDVEFLRNGFRGIGTDEEKVIRLCATRNNAQRNKLLLDYKTAYGRDLIEDVKGELSGNFKHLVLALFFAPAEYDAYCCKKAIYGLGTDEQALIEIMMTRTNAQLSEMKNQYNALTYEKLNQKGCSSLEKDIEGDTSGDFKRLLISASTANRRKVKREQLEEAVEEVTVNGKFTGMFKVNYKKLCNEKKCEFKAQELFKAGEDRWGTDEETFTRIFSVDDYFTLREVYDKYVKLSQRDIINSVDRETSGDYHKGLVAIAMSVKNRSMFFATKLMKAMKGLGTDDATLIRIIASRAEIDMVQIKQCFLELTKQTLWNYIKDDTSGDYKELLLGIVGRD